MTELNKDNYQGFVSSGMVLVDAWAGWCSQCPRMAAILDQTAPEFTGKVKIGKVDISQNMELGQKLGVTTLPTLLLYKDGKLIGQKTGIVTKPNLVSWLNQA
ncbi:thioredoxin family protein [Candidatus Saccharibacteria bacterium]|nr:thioredoxin family protein [Candidatus Saccharibacteria bacterium]